MTHPSARLSVFSRQLLIKRVVIDGWPTATVAEQLGISRATAGLVPRVVVNDVLEHHN